MSAAFNYERSYIEDRVRKSGQRQNAHNSDFGMEQNKVTHSPRSLMFNVLSNHTMESITKYWLGDREQNIVSNLRFADDIMLVVTTFPQISKMIEDLKKSSSTWITGTRRGDEDHESQKPQQIRQKTAQFTLGT